MVRKRKPLHLAELYELSYAMKAKFEHLYDLSCLEIGVNVTEDELLRIDEQLFFRNNPKASPNDFVHGDKVELNIDGIRYVFKVS